MNRILIGHVLDCLPELPDEYVHEICTSPPYWSLRDYKTEPQIWGGDNGCRHEWGNAPAPGTKLGRGGNTQGIYADRIDKTKSYANTGSIDGGHFCLHCGAWRGSLGLEPTPELYIEHIVEICRELRRVLRSDGVFWLNIGDSYATASPGTGNMEPVTWLENGKVKKAGMTRAGCPPNLKPKDLCLIPFRLALALQADGWWIRSACIWYKRNCMPESASDRPTVDYEYVFLLTKHAGTPLYWVHPSGIGTRELPEPDYRWRDEIYGGETDIEPDNWRTEEIDGKKRWRRYNLWEGHDYFYDGDAVRTPNTCDRHRGPNNYAVGIDATGFGGGQTGLPDYEENPAGRNLRTVWDIPTVSYSEAHFATFPPELAARCIKVTPMDVCAECGAGYERLTERTRENESYWAQQGKTVSDIYDIGKYGGKDQAGNKYFDRKRAEHDIRLGPTVSVETIGFAPTCTCNADKAKAVILDPFAGSGTVGQAANDLGREFILIELNPDYYKFMEKRLGLYTPEIEYIPPLISHP